MSTPKSSCPFCFNRLTNIVWENILYWPTKRKSKTFGLFTRQKSQAKQLNTSRPSMLCALGSPRWPYHMIKINLPNTSSKFLLLLFEIYFLHLWMFTTLVLNTSKSRQDLYGSHPLILTCIRCEVWTECFLCPSVSGFLPAMVQVTVHRIILTALFLLEMCFIFFIK